MKRKALSVIVGIVIILSMTPLLVNDVSIYQSDIQFDVETPEITTFRDDKPYALIISWDDLPETDIEMSLIEDRLGMKHTSFVVTRRLDEESTVFCLDLMFRGHDIQSHGWKHEALGKMSNISEVREIVNKSFDDIHGMFGFRPMLFAYPFGSADETSSEIVMEFFNYARGITYEGLDYIGEWPVSHPEYMGHSLPNAHGVCDETSSRIYSHFEKMLNPPARVPVYPDRGNTIKSVENETGKTFKLYGHTHSSFLNETSWTSFENELTRLSHRGDIWFTSWGEAFAYEALRSSTRLLNAVFENRTLSFEMEIDDRTVNDYPVGITTKVKIPWHWNSPLIMVDGKHLSDAKTIRDNNSRYLLFDIVPRNTSIVIKNDESHDSVAPIVSMIRVNYLAGHIILRFDVTDQTGLIRDVNVTVSDIAVFDEVYNPIFWNNKTYGLVLYGYEDLSGVPISISVLDSNHNHCTYDLVIK